MGVVVVKKVWHYDSCKHVVNRRVQTIEVQISNVLLYKVMMTYHEVDYEVIMMTEH